MTRHSRAIAMSGISLALLVGGCSAAADDGDDDLNVVVSFSALAYVTERVAGDDAGVTNLTPAGADPHNIELSGARLAELQESDLVVYLSGLQPATDDAVAQLDDVPLVDTVGATDVDRAGDPHFWLDPIRLTQAGHQVADALAEVDPDQAEAYRKRASELEDDLRELDEEYTDALASCAGATLVTSHEAFGYLADRYGLEQVGISGVDPEVEPSPARLRDITDVVRDTGVHTIFFEVNAGQDVAQVLADELGVRTDVLDPMERPADTDYLSVMRTNLDALTSGLVCDA